MHLFEKTTKKRILFFLIADIILITLSVYLAFLLRFDGKIPSQYFEGTLGATIILALIACLPVFYFSRLYSFSWSYVSTKELVSLANAVTLSFLLLGASLFILRDQSIFQGFPRSILIISYFLVFIFSGGIRFAKRVYLQSFKKGTEGRTRTLIVGAGDVGEQILRNILTSKDTPYLPIGFVDDSPAKKGVAIHGLEVLGKIEDIPKIADKREIEELIIALPTAGSDAIKRAVESGREAGLKKIKTIPSMIEIISGEVSLGNLREVQVEDLLGREPIEIKTKAIGAFIKEKIVLITGAAGSVGSELSRQIAKFKPSLLLLLDQDETGIFNILKELENKFPYLRTKSLIVDITDEKKINKIFNEIKPNIVFHAAAYKHVPLMETHFDEAVKNNVSGTKIIAEAALKNNTEKFIFISTDKAVNPTSVMGATKRVGEMICQNLNQKNQTKFISVRFGNVLDSRGSVIPIFRDQIRRGGPVEVTHPEMKRYFMVISEACLLVMQAAQMGQGGEVFVLNMGKPIKITDLAERMIQLSGLIPGKDIQIVYTGLRPGEKLYEELLTDKEVSLPTHHPKIRIARVEMFDHKMLLDRIDLLIRNVYLLSNQDVIDLFKELVPEYKSSNRNYNGKNNSTEHRAQSTEEERL